MARHPHCHCRKCEHRRRPRGSLLSPIHLILFNLTLKMKTKPLKPKPGMATHFCNLGTWEAQGRKSQVWGQLGWMPKTWSQKQKQTRRKRKGEEEEKQKEVGVVEGGGQGRGRERKSQVNFPHFTDWISVYCLYHHYCCFLQICCLHTHLEDRAQHQAFSPVVSETGFLNLELMSWLDWQTRKPQGCRCLCLNITGIQAMNIPNPPDCYCIIVISHKSQDILV